MPAALPTSAPLTAAANLLFLLRMTAKQPNTAPRNADLFSNLESSFVGGDDTGFSIYSKITYVRQE